MGVQVPKELLRAPRRILEVLHLPIDRIYLQLKPDIFVCQSPPPPQPHPSPPPLSYNTQEYVRSRIFQFTPALIQRINPGLAPEFIQQATSDTLQALPPPTYSAATATANQPPPSRELQLVFRHDCQSLGCLDCQCVLCEHNPHRRCSVNFAHKYLVNDTLKAKCDAQIRIEAVDRGTGAPVSWADNPEIALELLILDGMQYESKVAECTSDEQVLDLDRCGLLTNNKATPLLVAVGGGGSNDVEGRVILPMLNGVAVLPDLHVTDSSEAMLSGRKPPFRLLARIVPSERGGTANGVNANVKDNIRQAISEGFVVATRRTRAANKVEIPNVDDHVSKLEHMGKETVKKLQDLCGTAAALGLDLRLAENQINKVGEFRKLALLAEADGHLRQKLQQTLKLSKEKWEEARDHAMRAVVADNRMRIWYVDRDSMDVGLLFTCRLGTVDLERPVGLLHKKSQEGAQTTMEATLMAQQTPAQREHVRRLQPDAVTSWWQYGHPGWAIYPVDSEHFLATGSLDAPAVPAQDLLPPAAAAAAMAAAAMGSQLPVLPPVPALNANSLAGLMRANSDFFRTLPAFGNLNHQGRMGSLAGLLGGSTGNLAPLPQQQQQQLPQSAFAPAAGIPHNEDSPHEAHHQQQHQQTGNGTAAAAGSPSSSAQKRYRQKRQQDGKEKQAAQSTLPPTAGTGGGGSGHSPMQSAFANAPTALPQQQPHLGITPAQMPSLGLGLGLGLGRSLGIESMPSFNLANLQGMFGNDFAKFSTQLAAAGNNPNNTFNLANFPSIPMMMSGDLDKFLNQDAFMARLPSLMMMGEDAVVPGAAVAGGGGIDSGGGGLSAATGGGGGEKKVPTSSRKRARKNTSSTVMNEGVSTPAVAVNKSNPKDDAAVGGGDQSVDVGGNAAMVNGVRPPV